MWPFSRIGLWLRRRKIAAIHQRHRMRNTLAYAGIDEVLRKFRDAGGLRHDFQPYKLFQLQQILARFRPTSILEYGSGSSTSIFAAHARTHGGQLRSIDESSAWLDNARRLAGIETGDSQFELRNAEPVVGTVDGVPAVGYGLVPDRYFDLVFVDGPSLRIEGVKRKDAVNDDVFRQLMAFPPRVIVVDGRHATVRALERVLHGRYDCTETALMGETLADDYEYFSIFARIGDPAGHELPSP